MKNKKAEQIVAKNIHKEQLKNRRRLGVLIDRNVPMLIEKQTILIVCEGKNTETSYFNQFRLSSATVKSVGEGYNTISLVNRAYQLSLEKSYDQVWCVFDKDDFKDTDFNNAIQVAEAYGFDVAYSVQSFEYWIILHFDDHQGAGMHRDNYNDKINLLLKPFNIRYEGNGSKIISEELFELLDGFDEKTAIERKLLAIRRAERIYDNFDHINPAKEESSTTVFKLVSELLKYL